MFKIIDTIKQRIWQHFSLVDGYLVLGFKFCVSLHMNTL